MGGLEDEADLLYCLGFLDINSDFLEEDHPKYKFFIHDFFQTEEFKLLMIYKVLQNDSKNKIVFQQFSENSIN